MPLEARWAYLAVLGRLAAAGIGGGRTYDALIAVCASQAAVGTLFTLNPRHFGTNASSRNGRRAAYRGAVIATRRAPQPLSTARARSPGGVFPVSCTRA